MGKAEDTAVTCNLFFLVKAQLVENLGDSRQYARTCRSDDCCGTVRLCKVVVDGVVWEPCASEGLI